MLKLAFEINGIHHYEPIYGVDKLLKTQANDHKKYQSCLEKGIELCSINTSKQLHFKESNAAPFLKIIKDVLDQQIYSKNIDLHKLPIVVYDKKLRDTRLKNCKCCSKEFVYVTAPRQTFCSNECLKKHRRNTSYIHNHVLSHKETIRKCLLEGLSKGSIGKHIGFKDCGGGYYYTIKDVVKIIQEE